MEIKNYFGVLGALLIIAGGMSPMLHLPVIGNWNYWDIDVVLASVVFAFAGLGLLAAVLKKPALLRFSGWAVIAVVIFTLLAVYFKVNNYFNFIPFRKLAALATRIVHYRWLGWSILLLGGIIMVFSGRVSRVSKIVIKNTN